MKSTFGIWLSAFKVDNVTESDNYDGENKKLLLKKDAKICT